MTERPDLEQRAREILATIYDGIGHHRSAQLVRTGALDDLEIEQVAAITKALASSSAPEQWQPIETAPKDGSKVIVAPWNALGSSGWTVASWHAGVGVPYPINGRRKVDGWCAGGFFMGPQPTHWMPNLVPPEAPPAPSAPQDRGASQEDGR